MSTPDTSTLAGKIAVMQAAMEKPHLLQINRGDNPGWTTCGVGLWNWEDNDYRIKPEPQETWTPTGRVMWRRVMRENPYSRFHYGAPVDLHVEERSESGATRWVPVPVEE